MIDRHKISIAVAPLGRGEVAAFSELSSNRETSYRIDFASGPPLVLKVYAEADELPGSPAKDRLAAEQLASLPIPVSRFLVVDATQEALPFRFAITNYLPGDTVGALINHPDIANAYRQTGLLLRKLHEISMPSYGFFDADGIVAPVASNQAFVRNLIEHTFEKYSALGARDALAAQLRRKLEGGFDAVVPFSMGAVFAHDDLHPNNLLAQERSDGQLVLTGLLDFGNAHAADPVSDLAKCLFCFEHDAPGSAAFIREGYDPINHPDPETAIEFYTLLHRMIMWWWLRQVGIIATSDAPSDLIRDLRTAVE